MSALKGDTPRTPIQRLDYRPPAWWIETVVMRLELDPEETRVSASLRVRRNAEAEPDAPLELFGAGLETRKVAVDGRALAESDWEVNGERLVIHDVPDQACVTTEVLIKPSANTALEGLYQSGASLLTQCEAEGFRKITWFGDRPDIMARFEVRLEADQARYPVLLSNGNLIESGTLDGGRHYAVWDDPFPKPSYLFALVAGDLGCKEESFETSSGRNVALKIYSERENLGQLDHAMESLKKSMAWDEQRNGLEYDLDVYHIVATHDFNMGAMENKSLNIFNARYVLADPDTATDADFEAIEGVIAHEYFHNWTGNRVTCRDWFQLTLKEGLTVYRDQEFSADMQSRAVKRIHDVRSLMARQFPEDAGPMAHPVRPERYVEINNFYTATVYEKGAEVVRMYETLLGRDGFRKGMDLYFQRHDGQAVTCDDFRAAMADANDADLDQFERWYRQVGTPRVAARSEFDESTGTLALELSQSLPAHQDNTGIGPLHLPLRLGLVDRDGTPLETPLDEGPARETHLVELREATATVRFSGLEREPVVSLLRGFSAPVDVDYDWSDRDLATLMAFDPDPMARWLAGRRLVTRVLRRDIESLRAGEEVATPVLLIDAWRSTLAHAGDDPALAAELLVIPSESELARDWQPVPVDEIHAARNALRLTLARTLDTPLAGIEGRRRPAKGWAFRPADVAGRSLANLVLGMRVAAGRDEAVQRAGEVFARADNMTDRFAALAALVHADAPGAGERLAEFEQRYRDNPLVMDKWFALQAHVARPETVGRVRELMEHPAFSMRNPNKVRSLIGTLGMANPVAFHRADGEGYRLIGEAVRMLDGINPQVAARLVSVFNRFVDYDPDRAALMKQELETIRGQSGLSPDVGEIVGAALRREP